MNQEEYKNLTPEQKVEFLEAQNEKLQDKVLEVETASEEKDKAIAELNTRLSAAEKTASKVEMIVEVEGTKFIVNHGVKYKGETYSKEELAANKDVCKALAGKSTALTIKK